MNEITVVIPTYNSKPFIAETIQSVLAQTLPPAEIIVVDDCSTDTTCEIVEHLAKESHVPIQLIRLTENAGGPATPLNAGILAAKTEYVALLDHDDIFLPENLEMKRDALREYPESQLVLADFQLFNMSGLIRNTTARDYAIRHHTDYICNKNRVCAVPIIQFLRSFAFNPGLVNSCSNMYFHKKMWSEVNGFAPIAGASADTDFIYRSVRKPVVWVDRILFHRRMHDTNVTKIGLGAVLSGHKVIVDWIKKNNRLFSELERTLILEIYLTSIQNAAQKAKQRRDWNTYWKIRNHITSYCNPKELISITHQKIYPPFAYQVKDVIRNTLRYFNDITKNK